ncbi:hypothetical protein [Methylobacterium soli]
MMTTKLAAMGRNGAIGLAVATLLAFGATREASAAPAADRISTKVADAGQALRPVAAVAEAEDEGDTANCSRSRRRLWVEGEGWIVRRITTCR